MSNSWIENINNLEKYGSRDFLTQVLLGNVPGHSLFHKFGMNTAIGTDYAPISVGGVYPMPLVNTSLEIISTSPEDNAAGTGAQEVTLRGLVLQDGDFVEQTTTVVPTGTTAAPVSDQFIRLPRDFVSKSGTYADITQMSSAGTITVREAGGGANWLTISEFATGMSAGQSQCALVSTPSNTRMVLYAPLFTIEAGKDVSVFMMNREGADTVIAPFTAGRMVQQWVGLQQPAGIPISMPVAKFEGATDIGYMAKVGVGTAVVSAEFWGMIIEDGY